jgi:hypothetical protein
MADEGAVFDAFLAADEAASTMQAFADVLAVAGCSHLQGTGLELYNALKAALAPKLNYRVGKLFPMLDTRLDAAQKLTHSIGGVQGASSTFRVLVCGAGPVGLRSAVEAALHGLEVVVVEKRTSFSRANIITTWDETMADLLTWGAKIYRPDLCSTGNPKHVGTRELQLILLKNLLLLGGTVRYGMRIVGLVPPDPTGRWQGRFVPYVRPDSDAGGELDAAARALEFQRFKDYEEGFTRQGNKSKLLESCELDPAFIAAGVPSADAEERVAFDAYFIAEGGWSDSTRRLGFNKIVTKRNPTYGLVINFEYNKDVPAERKMKSRIWHTLGDDWPLKDCVILAEFLEYLKVCFFPLVPCRGDRGEAEDDVLVVAMHREEYLVCGEEEGRFNC